MYLSVSYLAELNRESTMEAIQTAFSNLTAFPIAIANWKEFDYKPDVSFKIAYTNDCILLNYHVHEKFIKASYVHSNEPVYKDSCVEFFISFSGDNYYNFEFNSIGTALVGYGNEHDTRKLLASERIKTMDIDTTIHTNGKGASWSLMAKIPLSIFAEHKIESLKGLKCTANFYKCGDDLPIPHYLSWNAIDFPKPNFHLPTFFGEVTFV